MTDQANPQVADALVEWAGSGHEGAKHLGAWLGEFFATCTASLDAAAHYERLSRLCDAELARRGISRGELPRRVFEALAQRRR